MTQNPYRDYINEVLPKKFQRALIPWMEKAYNLVNTEMARDFYQFPTAKKNTGNLVNIAIDGCLATMIDRGILEAEYEFATYPQSSQKYLKVITNGAMLVHCRVPKPSSFVRKALHRDYQRLANITLMPEQQLSLDFGEDYLEQEMGPIPEHPLLVLTHSTKGFDFVNISLAHFKYPDWLYQTQNLKDELHVVEEDLPKAERPDEEALLKLLRTAMKSSQELKQNDNDRGTGTRV